MLPTSGTRVSSNNVLNDKHWGAVIFVFFVAQIHIFVLLGGGGGEQAARRCSCFFGWGVPVHAETKPPFKNVFFYFFPPLFLAVILLCGQQFCRGR
jgi:hypothetical protein